MRERHHSSAGRSAARSVALTILALALLAAPLVGTAASSNARSLPATPRISLTKPPTSVVLGSPIVMRGTVSPAGRRYTLTLERRGAKAWLAVQSQRSTARGAFTFSLRATSSGASRYRIIAGTARRPSAASRVIRVTIHPKAKVVAAPIAPALTGPVIGTTVLPFGTLGVAYTAKLSTNDARAGTWSVASGTLPSGLALAASGQLTGTPTQNGSSSFVVAFTDAANGRATQQLALAVYPPPAVTQVSAGYSSACALRVDETVACWGSDEDGRLGSTAAGRSGTLSTPVQVDGLSDATAVGVGYDDACALHAGGSVSCWGRNLHGELGDGTIRSRRALAPVVGIADATAISVGGVACALRRGGAVSCWGPDSGVGMRGDGTSQDSRTATPVLGITDATAISSGSSQACALHATGTVSCWGDGTAGELGDGVTSGPSAVPVTVAGLTDAVGVSSGVGYTCAVRATGGVVCWGIGEFGALGDGSVANSNTPVAVIGLSDAVAVGVGRGACALRATGTVACWGEDFAGPAVSSTYSLAPIAVGGFAGASAISMGYGFACALVSSRVACWGADEFGQAGQQGGQIEVIHTPTLVNGV